MTTQGLSFLNGSSSFLHVTRTTIKVWLALSFNQVHLPTTELAALKCLKNDV